MNSLRDLLQEYDQLGEAAFSSPHDFTLRQRKLENWAAKARNAIEALVKLQTSDESERDASRAHRNLKRTGS